MLSETLRPGGFIAIMIWVELFAFALVVGLQIARSEKRFALSDRQRDVALYALVILAVATPALFFFLKALAYFTSPWYYLALLAIAAVCIDTIFGAVCQTRVTRICRLAVVLVFVATTYPLALTAVEMRMTNIDRIAATVETTASRGDLIVVSPWYVGISFGRYYSGDVPWMTMPPIGSPKYHRYDLVKPKMVMADQTAAVRPVVEAAAEALRNGGKVFVVGDFRYPPNGQQPTVLPPAPIPGHGWPTVTYDQQWSAMLGSFLRDNAATIETVSITGLATVNSNEEPDLRVARGWRPSAAGTPGPQVDVTRAPAAVPSSPDSPGPAPRRGGATSSTLPASSGMHP